MRHTHRPCSTLIGRLHLNASNIENYLFHVHFLVHSFFIGAPRFSLGLFAPRFACDLIKYILNTVHKNAVRFHVGLNNNNEYDRMRYEPEDTVGWMAGWRDMVDNNDIIYFRLKFLQPYFSHIARTSVPFRSPAGYASVRRRKNQFHFSPHEMRINCYQFFVHKLRNGNASVLHGLLFCVRCVLRMCILCAPHNAHQKRFRISPLGANG